MPAYDFKCKSCADVFEVTRPASDSSPVACPACGGDTKRVFTPVGVHFKGSGFYTTDNKGKTAASAAKKADEAPASCPAKESGTCSSCPGAE